MRAVVLLSGGLDSATAAAIAQSQGYSLYALTVNYGQRHVRELASAKHLASHFNVIEHFVVDVPFIKEKSSLLNESIPVPRCVEEGILNTYVPGRNLVLLSLAVSYAETLNVEAVYTGMNAQDYSGYPDCRPEFLAAFQEASKLATVRGISGKPIKIEAPLMYMKKRDIILKAHELGVPLESTWSCYMGGEKACGTCPSCLIRLRGFKEAGLKDPIEYEVISQP